MRSLVGLLAYSVLSSHGFALLNTTSVKNEFTFCELWVHRVGFEFTASESLALSGGNSIREGV